MMTHSQKLGPCGDRTVDFVFRMFKLNKNYKYKKVSSLQGFQKCTHEFNQTKVNNCINICFSSEQKTKITPTLYFETCSHILFETSKNKCGKQIWQVGD